MIESTLFRNCRELMPQNLIFLIFFIDIYIHLILLQLLINEVHTTLNKHGLDELSFRV